MPVIKQIKQLLNLRGKLLHLQGRNFFSLKTGDTLKAVALRRKTRQSTLSRNQKTRLIKIANTEIRKHVKEARRLTQEAEEAELAARLE